MTTPPTIGRPRRTLRSPVQHGHDVKPGDAPGGQHRRDHGRHDRAEEHPEHARPRDLEGADDEVSVTGCPPGEAEQRQQNPGCHGDGRRNHAEDDSLAEDVSAQLAPLGTVRGCERHRAALTSRADGKSRAGQEGGLDEKADHCQQHDQVERSLVRAGHAGKFRIHLSRRRRVEEDLTALDQQAVAVHHADV